MGNNYCDLLRKHYENYYGISGREVRWNQGPIEKLHPDFYILEVPPNSFYKMWTYLTVGMSLDRNDQNLIEVFVFSPEQNESIIELLTVNASFHRNAEPVNLEHTVNFGEPWLNNSKCDHGYISLPYLDGEDLELFQYDNKMYHCYWMIPITKEERDFKVENGSEALEQLFEEKQVNYLDPNRKSLV